MRIAFTSALCLIAVVAAPVYAKPGDMNLAVFMAKAERLKSKGPLALVSKDFKVVKGEVEGAAATYKAKIKSDKEAGRTPHSCPKKGGSMSSDELLAHFETYPKSKRASTSVRTAFYDLMKKKFPC